jgi:hypothetical protein
MSSSGGKAVQRTLGSDQRISKARKKSGPSAGGETPRPSKLELPLCRRGTDTIDQTAKAALVPAAWIANP